MTSRPFDVDLMTLTEAADYLRVHPADLLQAAEDGKIPSHCLSGEVLFVRDELLEELSRPHPCSRD
jgi:excisionase family DNA binding protein